MYYIFFLVRPCDSGPCKNGGNCTDDGVKCFKCECPTGFKGSDCSEIGKVPFVRPGLHYRNTSIISKKTKH